jgi:Sulfotransferase family
MDWEAPIVIVGAGRSGTTLLASILGEHPDIYMIGETSFLLPRLWETFFSRPEYVRNYRLGKLSQTLKHEWRDLSWFSYWQGILNRDLARIPNLSVIEEAENARIAKSLGMLFADTLIPPDLRRPRWGFKEIWNGGDSFNYPWGIYTDAFPKAKYVQCVRNPFAFAKSYFANNQKQPSGPDLIYLLTQWLKIVERARELSSTGRYLELRLENLELDRLFEFVGLNRHPNCAAEMGSQHLPSNFQVRMPDLTSKQIAAIPGFARLVESLRYQLVHL